MGLDLLTTCIGERRNSGQQEMGETREPMASDCWTDAQRLAEIYSKTLRRDFWICYAAKPHTKHNHAVVAGWEVIAKRPPAAMVGVLVFKWSHAERILSVETDLCLPYDVPLSDAELSTNARDVTESIGKAAAKSGSILLA
jgi:hypothetical protein